MHQRAIDKKFQDCSLERGVSWKKYKWMIETEENRTKGFVLSNAFIQFNFHKYLFTQELSLHLTYSFYLAL